jgi:DNA-binding protein HU-beta
MTKAELVASIANKTGYDRKVVSQVVESLMKEVKGSLIADENVYLRGFGSFIVKTRKRKLARNISKNTSVEIPEHKVPAFKPAQEFKLQLK